jgi:hypothetical protein
MMYDEYIQLCLKANLCSQVREGVGNQMYLLLQHTVECLNDPRRMPPFRRLDTIRNGGVRRTALRLDFA